MLKRCFFWLPVLYLLISGLAYVDMMAGLSGQGEGNVGVYIYLYSFKPYALVTKVLGFGWYYPPRSVVRAIVMQAVGLMLMGALVDAIVSTSKR